MAPGMPQACECSLEDGLQTLRLLPNLSEAQKALHHRAYACSSDMCVMDCLIGRSWVQHLQVNGMVCSGVQPSQQSSASRASTSVQVCSCFTRRTRNTSAACTSRKSRPCF